jgi:hypothetical protein
MQIFEVNGSEGCELCHPVDPKDFETVTLLCNGQPRRHEWVPLRFHCVRKDEGKILRRCDSPWLGDDVLVVRETVVSCLGDLLNEYGELLPLDVPGESLWLFNATRVIDCLDHEQTQVTRFSSGRLMSIDRHVFRPEAIAGVMIFKIPDLRSSSLYFARDFVELWRDTKLTGLDFDLVWSDDG